MMDTVLSYDGHCPFQHHRNPLQTDEGKMNEYLQTHVHRSDTFLNVTPQSYNKRGKMSIGGISATLPVKKWTHFPKQIPATASKQILAKACTVCTAYQK